MNIELTEKMEDEIVSGDYKFHDEFSEMWEYVSEKSERLRNIKDGLTEMGFFHMPASRKYHGAYVGGLFDHSYMVAMSLRELTDKLGLKWEREDSPEVVGILHDLCKCGLYRICGKSTLWLPAGWEYTNDNLLSGHGGKSVILAQQLTRLTMEEIMCIRWHMGAFEKDTKLWNYYGKAVEKYPNVLYAHTADMIASRVKGV